MMQEVELGPATENRIPAPWAPRQLPAFTIPDSEIGMGASLGNSSVWIATKNTGAIERVSSVDLAQSLIGAIVLRYGTAGSPLGSSRHDGNTDDRFVALRPDGPRRTFEIHPAYQRVACTIAGSIEVTETTFLPLLARQTELEKDPPVVYQLVSLRNSDVSARLVRVTAYARLRGSMAADIEARYDPGVGALVARSASNRDAVRIFGMAPVPARYGATFDFGSVYDPSHLHALTNSTEESGDVLGCLQFDVTLEPNGSYEFAVQAGVFAAGEDDALERYRSAPNAPDALRATIRHLEERLAYTEVVTPDALINQAALWSKVNMRRVMATFPQGRAFTNDPGNSPNVVVRDAAWFVFGNDHFIPEFSRSLLQKLIAVQYPNGKMPEFFNGITGEIEDDGLNINDDTPLFVLAAHHHFQATGDKKWLESAYPAVAKAARYILSQRDRRGLVFCDASDPRGNVWAIASWRNIIPLYAINGAVTEINAECAAALRAAAELACELESASGDSREFSSAYEVLREAINSHLINPENGLYYLNIDVNGNVHTDVTGDEVFPVMFRVAGEETAFRVISRLNAPDFWTHAGLRTASRNDPLYEPSAYSGLLGGVWPGLTWWYAFAAARYHPEFMVRALRSSFEHYGADPKKNNTVPGQFSEWFDGESLTNKGMRLSPWEPPRFLWAAVEGVCGLNLATGTPRINPLIPANWAWVGLRRLRYHGGSLSYFMIRKGSLSQIYSTALVESDSEVAVFDADVSDEIAIFSTSAVRIALRDEDTLVVLVGNVGTQTTTVPIDMTRVIGRNGSYLVRVFNSERDSWEAPERQTGRELCTLAISIEPSGFRLLQIRAV